MAATDTPIAGEPPEALSVNRSEALSDGIYAVAMTLLVIDLKLPDAAALHAGNAVAESLLALLPKALAWLMSFFVLSLFWLGHHRVFNHVRPRRRHAAHLEPRASRLRQPDAVLLGTDRRGIRLAGRAGRLLGRHGAARCHRARDLAARLPPPGADQVADRLGHLSRRSAARGRRDPDQRRRRRPGGRCCTAPARATWRSR